MGDLKISNLLSDSSPSTNDVLPLVDTTNAVTKKITLTNLISFIFQNRTDSNGWTPVGDTWTYSSVSGIQGVITVPTDATQKYAVGDRVKFTQTTTKYFVITAVTSTTITVTGGTDYSLANAAISGIYYSKEINPVGFPSSFAYTATWTGFSSPPPGTARFSINGRVVTVTTRQGGGGTSNATTTTFSLPVTSANNSQDYYGAGAVLDNNAWQSSPGWFEVVPNSATASMFKVAPGGTWTASGLKVWMGIITYEI